MKTSLDLFSGIGGWSLACEANGIATVAACELDDWKREQYAQQFPSVRLYKDVRRLTGRMLKDDGIAIDYVVGSPPCTDASAANHRGKGIDGEETGLFLEAIRLLDEIRPRGACFENSPRLRTRGVDRIKAEMAAIGYACWPVVVGAVHAGAPHLRQRLWLVAADADRFGLRDVRGRGGGSRRLGRTEPSHDADADGVRQSRQALDAEVGGRKGADGVGCGGAEVADADGKQRRRRATRQNGAQTDYGSGGHSNGSRLAIGESLNEDHGEKFTAAERATHGGWSNAAGSLARHLRVDDGISSTLAADCRSAFGDAVVPQVGAAALAGMLALERFLMGAPQ